MTDIRFIALGLLILRLIATYFIGAVLLRQYKLMRLHASEDIGLLRKVLMALAVVIFLGQFIPITIDTTTLIGVQRSLTLGVAYAFSNASTAVVSCVLLWVIYRVTEAQNVRLAQGKHRGDETKL